MDQNIIDTLAPIFHTIFNNEDIVISSELSAKDVADWDSMNHINLIIAVETEFNIRFSNNEISELENVGQLIDLIRGKVEQ